MKISFPYYNLLDGLRGFAIISVFYAHSVSSSLIVMKLHLENGGFIGVDMFFVLSSFLISTLLLKEYLTFGNISIKKFYIRRLIRLMPPMLLAIVIFIPIVFFIDWKAALTDLFYAITYSANIARSLQRFIPPVFQPNYFAHTWSLATEEQFYLGFPFLLLYMINKKIRIFASRKHVLLGLFAVFITAPLLRPILRYGVYDFPIWRLGEFSIGFITALIYINIMWREQILQKIPSLSLTEESIKKITSLVRSSSLSLFCFWLLFAFIISARTCDYFVLFIVHPLAAIITSILILQITISPNQIVKYFFGSKLMIKIGTISYGLYIYHYPILRIKNWFFTEKFVLDRVIPFKGPLHTLLSFLVQDTIMVTLTVLIAYMSYKFIEIPILKYKVNFNRS
jgi:peptidoglycan/LPS O-acetylase OafA/YrhL